MDNFYKFYVFNYFLLKTVEAKEIRNSLRNNKEKILSKEELIIKNIQKDKKLNNKDELLKRIKKYATTNDRKIIINSIVYKRDAYQMALIKKYRNFECQFCFTKILKKDGNYYIEACHIIPKSKGGSDELNNILILCPNCHKLFDLGDRREILHNNKKYIVEINKKIYEIKF